MELNDYQAQAKSTDTTTEKPDQKYILPLLGLAGEAAGLLSAYKKHLRDGPTYTLYKEEVSEELGDTLWYLATVATHYGLDLEEVAASNLRKVAARFTPQVTIRNLDADFPVGERFPRQFEVDFLEAGGRVRAFRAKDGERFGDPLTDNSHDEDGYRFHDALHLAFVAVLGWSPTVRGLMRLKRKSTPEVDEIEDGGRAIVIDEALTAFIFEYARVHDMLRNATAIDFGVLRTVMALTSRLEVSVRTAFDWEKAILAGFNVFRALWDAKGGRLLLDLDARTIEYHPINES